MWEKIDHRFYYDKHNKAYTFRDAVEDLLKINREISEHLFDPKEYTRKTIIERVFQNAFENFLEKKEEEYAPSNKYRTYYRNYFGYFNDMDVRDIKLKHLDTFYRKSLPRHLSWKYKNNIMAALFAFLRWLKRWGDIKELPTFPELEPNDSTPRLAPDYEEQQTALENIPASHRDIIDFLIQTGMRPGEACALKIGDIRKGRALIQRTYSGSELRDRPKNRKKKWRTLSTRAIELVRRNIGTRGDDEFVFINPATKRGYRLEFLRKMWKKHSGADFDLYSNRHAYGTQLAEMGIGEIELQDLMGHADIRSTRAYFHPTEDRQRDLLDGREQKQKRGNVIELKRRRK